MRPLAAAAALLGIALLSGRANAAPTKEACAVSYEQGQKLRAQGKLSAARREFLVCAEASCPNVTKTDCGTWLGEVDASLPTVTFAVFDRAGKDVADVRVFVDGAVLVERLDGKALPIDPGAHKLRFERVGEPTVDVELVVREGEKNRRVEVRFGGDAPKGGGGGIEHVSPAAWALGVPGVVGLGVFGVLGGLALSEKSEAEETCSPSCSDDVIDSIQTKFIAADVALSVGLVALAAGVAIGVATGLTGGDDDGTSVSFFVAPSPFGATGGFLGRF